MSLGLSTACQQSGETAASPTPTTEQQAEADWASHMEKAWQETRKAVESLAPIKDKVTTGAQEEYSKLFGMEYHVVELDASESAQAMEEELLKLGKERWDCFHIMESEDKLRLICKRRPETWLRHIGRLAPLMPIP
ncbi:MAG: hypothetical protein QY326_05630 [Bdellovibrionota bacterium]|nr:MAG: hypothetical protein QY326_05630 [Bdellovibrionota bacterium]